MSQWTHVAAVIRYDSLRLGALGLVDDPNYHDPLPELHGGVPTGSEGPLQVHLSMNPDPQSVAAYVVTVFGDLRDYDNVAEIVAFLHRITARWEGGIRAGVAYIDVEGRPPVVLHFDGEKGWQTCRVS